jgi:hypothetical protein
MLTVSALHPIIARVYSNNAWYRPGGYRINPYYSGVRMGRAKHIRVTFIWQFEVVYILAPSAQQARVLGAWYGLAHGELSQEYAPFQNVLAWYLAHRRFKLIFFTIRGDHLIDDTLTCSVEIIYHRVEERDVHFSYSRDSGLCRCFLFYFTFLVPF